MNVVIERFAYLETRTLGRIYVGPHILYTLERPWVPTPYHRGGTNYESCVPDGEYSLQPFESSNHHNCYSLENPDLDVYLKEPADKGRWAILIHPGNFLKDIVGCIAPGLTGDEKNVWNSITAMNMIRTTLGKDSHTLTIRPKGATNEKVR